jgi:DNA-binding CsgD family transcriptional regulator
VPRSIVSERDARFALGILRPLEGDQQLALPYVLGPIEHLAFVLARTRKDFSDDDLEVARQLQPALVLLHRQSQVLATAERSATRSALEAGLTGREYAVLRLLADGHTALSIARRLSTSARTVHKHLEHIYSKLGVHDRLSAVRVASWLGILDPGLSYELVQEAGAAGRNGRQVRTCAYTPQVGDRRSWSAMESVR